MSFMAKKKTGEAVARSPGGDPGGDAPDCGAKSGAGDLIELADPKAVGVGPAAGFFRGGTVAVSKRGREAARRGPMAARAISRGQHPVSPGTAGNVGRRAATHGG